MPTVISDTSGQGISHYNPYRYRSYYYDRETGLYYLQSRYYDPQVGRFVNSDDPEMASASNSILQHNLFAYCENDAVNHSDYMGYLTLNANWFGLSLDIAFTFVSYWLKIGYDVIASVLRYYANAKKFTLFFDKLLYGLVPKVRWTFSGFFTLIRKAMWRFAGNIASNLTTSFFGYAISNFVSKILYQLKKFSANKIIKIIFRCLTLGSMIALILDWITDGDPFNEKIRF